MSDCNKNGIHKQVVLQMRISYNKLQKLMIDNQMKRQDLMRAAEITSYAATKINKNEPVSLEVLAHSYLSSLQHMM